MRIALVRGQYLKPQETEFFYPLVKRHNLVAYSAKPNLFDVDAVRLPVRELPSFEHATSWIPGGLSKLAKGALKNVGLDRKLIGLEGELADVDIAHAKGLTHEFTAQTVRAAQKDRPASVVTVWQNIPFHRPQRFGWATRNDDRRQTILQGADHFVAKSERASLALRLEGVDEDRISVIPAGVDTERFSPGDADQGLRDDLGIEDHETVLLFVGRLSRQKGVLHLIHALYELQGRLEGMRKVRLLVRGEGPEEEALQERIEDTGLEESVTFVPRLPYEALPDLYRSSDVFVLPSIPTRGWQEQFGFVLAEAMATGLPVLAARSGSIPEVVGEAGELVQPADALALADGLQEIIQDSDHREHLSKRGRERAIQRYDSKEVAVLYERLYEELT